MSSTWQFYAIRSTFGWFIGTEFGAPGWGIHVEDAYPLPSYAAAERWVSRLREAGYARQTLQIIPVDVSNDGGPTRVVGLLPYSQASDSSHPVRT
jgi:hypothetical protein